MKLSDYGKRVSEQLYIIDSDTSYVDGMIYKSSESDVDISIEHSQKSDFKYLVNMVYHGKDKNLYTNTIPNHINMLKDLYNQSNDKGEYDRDKLLGSKMYTRENSDLTSDGKQFICGVPMKFKDGKEVFYSFNVDSNKFAIVKDNKVDVCYNANNQVLEDFRIEIFGTSAFTYNISENPFAIDNYTILSKDGTNISTRYTGFFQIKSECMKNISDGIFIPQFLIFFDNGVEQNKLCFKYDEYGILMDSTEHMTRYERTEDTITCCHPLYIESFNPEFYYDDKNKYWLMESIDLLGKSVLYRRSIYKVDDKVKLDELKDFILNGDETKLLLEIDED